MDGVESRFTQLVSLALDGSLSDAEQEEVLRLIEAHPQLALGQVEDVFTHNLLVWESEDISELVTMELAASAAQGNSGESPSRLSRAGRKHGLWAAAAVLLVAAITAAWLGLRSGSADELAIADVVREQGVVWAVGSSAVGERGSIIPGRLETDAGTFTLQFRSGPTVKIVGPAALDVESDMLLRLELGQATARVPPSSKGFAIKTPVAKVVDQGTEFGVVARDDGMTDVIVFEGRVDVQDMAGSVRQPRSMLIGEAARINALGSMDRIMEVGRDPSGRWWTSGPNRDEHLIASVGDNIVTDVSDRFTCYQTTYGGLQDDALAYADNPHHQWNGLTAGGLPKFLRGADYVKTFNDYRYRQDFQLTIAIARPINLYVFADNRIPPPDWLKAQFEDTGVDVGLDEGPWLYQAPEEYRQLDKNTTAVGGGNSIDNVFSVWHRRCVNLMPVTLGDAGAWASEGKQGRAMYGIAATPLEE